MLRVPPQFTAVRPGWHAHVQPGGRGARRQTTTKADVPTAKRSK